MARRVLLLISGLVAFDPLEAAAVRYGASTTLGWAENASRSTRPADERDTFVGEAELTAAYDRPLAPFWSARARVEVATRQVPEFERTSTTEAGLDVAVQRKFGSGPLVPTLVAGASIHRRDARLAPSDAWSTAARVRLTKRITELVRLGLTGDWRQDYARHAAFDTRARRVVADVAWDVTDRWQIAAGAGRVWGDFTVHASPSSWTQARSGQLGPDLARYYGTLAWLATDSYGPGWVSYRIDGRANIWWMEIAPALDERTAIVLRHEAIHTRNGAAETYQQRFWTLRLVHEF